MPYQARLNASLYDVGAEVAARVASAQRRRLLPQAFRGCLRIMVLTPAEKGRRESFEADPGQRDLLRTMAGDKMAGGDFIEVGRLGAADFLHVGATGVEVAA